MDNNLKRTIILEHFQNPKNKGLIKDDNYKFINMNNESCIDEVNLMVKFNGDLIEDIRFDGEACAISTSATSIMSKLLEGKTIDEIKILIDNYENMIKGLEYDENILKEAIVYNEIYKQHNRINCAMLPWKGIKKIIEEISQK